MATPAMKSLLILICFFSLMNLSRRSSSSLEQAMPAPTSAGEQLNDTGVLLAPQPASASGNNDSPQKEGSSSLKSSVELPWWLNALWSLLALIVKELAFKSILELLIGVYMLHKLSLFERRMSTRAFAAFVAVVFVLSWSIAVALKTLIGWKRADGPYSVIFALLLAYHRQVPAVAVVGSGGHVQRFRIARCAAIPITSKSALYAAGCMLALCHWNRSVLAAVIGLCCGALYYSPALSLHTLRPPPALCAFCQRHLLPLLQRHPRATPAHVQIFAQPVQLWSND
jgi:hypothetical protein